MLGDDIKAGLMGNRPLGDEQAPAWENLLDLSHSVYSKSHHSYLYYNISNKARFGAAVKGFLMKLSLKNSIRWSVFIFFLTFVFACIFSVVSTMVLEGVAWATGMGIVLLIVVIGVVFDMMGIASTAAQERPFHAMAAERVKGAKHAIHIVRNADRFASFCNDVIGDISGIISGAASTIVILKLFQGADQSAWYYVVLITFTALVSGLTVGGKAIGKTLAIHNATPIILLAGKVFYFMEHRLRIKIFQGKKNKGNQGKRGNKHAAR
jgi:hypothetical protein